MLLPLIDKPTSGVSPRAKSTVTDTLVPVLKGSGVTTIFVEHDMDVIQRYAKRVQVRSSPWPPETVLRDPALRAGTALNVPRGQGLVVRLGGLSILGLSLDVPAGDIVGFVGGNGAAAPGCLGFRRSALVGRASQGGR